VVSYFVITRGGYLGDRADGIPQHFSGRTRLLISLSSPNIILNMMTDMKTKTPKGIVRFGRRWRTGIKKITDMQRQKAKRSSTFLSFPSTFDVLGIPKNLRFVPPIPTIATPGRSHRQWSLHLYYYLKTRSEARQNSLLKSVSNNAYWLLTCFNDS